MDNTINKKYFKEKFNTLESGYHQYLEKEKKIDSKFSLIVSTCMIACMVTLIVGLIAIRLIKLPIIDYIAATCVILLISLIIIIFLSLIVHSHMSNNLRNQYNKETKNYDYLKSSKLLNSLNDIYIGEDLNLKRKYQLIDYDSLKDDELLFSINDYKEISSSILSNINENLIPEKLNLEEKYNIVQSYLQKVNFNINKASVSIELNHIKSELGE